MNLFFDTSVVLAHLLAEDFEPPAAIWTATLFASRLLEYETWNRLHASKLAVTHGEAARGLLMRVNWVELAPEVLERALEPFPIPTRTLDALHLASMDFLVRRKLKISLVSLDRRMCKAARALNIPVYSFPQQR